MPTTSVCAALLMRMAEQIRARGGCLCGAVRFAVRGPLREVVYCHCRQCQRSTGHYMAATACDRNMLTIEDESALAWYRSSTAAERGFCARCGSTLFWRPARAEHIAIAAGSLDVPSGLRGIAHIFVADAGDYYEILDGLPQHEQSGFAAWVPTPE